MLLRLDNVDTYYGQIHILQGVSLEVNDGELVCLLGGNASGKSTTLKTIIGMVRPRRGAVQFAGEEVSGRPTTALRGIEAGMGPPGPVSSCPDVGIDGTRSGRK